MTRMTARGELPLAGKLTIRAGGRKLVLVKRAWESERHVLLKALIFALYVPAYPGLAVERAIGHRYKPDLVEMGDDGSPVFWAECGETSRQKLDVLVRTLPGDTSRDREAGHADGTVRGDAPRGARGWADADRSGRVRERSCGWGAVHRDGWNGDHFLRGRGPNVLGGPRRR